MVFHQTQIHLDFTNKCYGHVKTQSPNKRKPFLPTQLLCVLYSEENQSAQMVETLGLLPAKMSNLTAIVLDTEMDAALRLIAKTGYVHFSDVKESQKPHLKKLTPVEASERYYYLANLLTRITTLITDMKVNRGGKAKERLTVPEIPDDTYFQKIEANLKAIEDDFNDLTRKLKAAEDAKDKQAKKETKKEIEAYAKEKRFELLGWEELIDREHHLEEIKTFFGKTHRTYILYGWIPTKKQKEFMKYIEEHGNGRIALDIRKHTDKPEGEHYPADVGPLALGAAEPEEPAAPPTQQTNSRWVRSFQILTNAFGFPSHNELDPSWFMALSLPIFFGLMFGDIGHGLILFFFAMLGFIAKRRNIDAGEMVNYFIQGSGMLMLVALTSVFFGILYGEFLGIDISALQIGGVYMYQGLKYSPFGQACAGFLANLFRVFDFEGGLNWFIDPHSPYNAWILGDPHGHPTPIWFSAFEMPESLPATIASPTWILFVLSIMIGFMHLSIAISFDGINKIRHRDWRHAIFGPIIWLAFLWGLAYMIFNYGINFMSWPIIEMVLFLILPLIILLIGGMIAFGFMTGFMEGIEKLIESISNTISYSRILALNMAHAGFAKTFLFIGGVAAAEITVILAQLATGGVMFLVSLIAMLLIGTIFVLLMEGLLSFIHSLRLMWVEAYLKFYAGTGIQYEPLMVPAKWTTTGM
jgi:vacuolar-type H+-ATPase subunit I/STV1